MFLPCYQAMTSAEFHRCADLPENMAWMACHFSSSDEGLSNLPVALPEGSLIIVDDWIPINGHDPTVIEKQLRQLILQTSCAGILLDFQRESVDETAFLCKHLTVQLPFPIAITEDYAKDLDCAVFLSSPAPHVSLETHIKPWANREIWLELATDPQHAIITEEGTQITSYLFDKLPEPQHKDNKCHCHYHWYFLNDTVHFYLQRTKEDIIELQQEAASLGVRFGVGLYQQLK